MPGPGGNTEVFVNHERSRVPFGGSADFDWASVSHLTLAPNGGVLAGSEPLPDSAGFQRFCSATMAGPNEGLSSYIYLTGEEAPERVAVPAGAPYGPDPAYAPANDRQSGFAAVLDPVTGDFTQVAGMGRHNHENAWSCPVAGTRSRSCPATTRSLLLRRLPSCISTSRTTRTEIWADEGTLLGVPGDARNGRQSRCPPDRVQRCERLQRHRPGRTHSAADTSASRRRSRRGRPPPSRRRRSRTGPNRERRVPVHP